MSSFKPIPVIDLFAGPGGLSEGFSVAKFKGRNLFDVRLSIEKDPIACKTLRLRNFFRLARQDDSNALRDYYSFAKGEDGLKTVEQLLERHPSIKKPVDMETFQATLGTTHHDVVAKRIRNALGKGASSEPWVLIGGPPCQAYSLVGRARMQRVMGDEFYEDERHTLYRQYLKIIQEFRPTAFVMENVKGILSSRLQDELIFRRILHDLSGNDSRDGRYKLYSLSSAARHAHAEDGHPESADFLVRSEVHGIPQARHRVFILGVREDVGRRIDPSALALRPRTRPVTVGRALTGLPKLRSGLSQQTDTDDEWLDLVRSFVHKPWALKLADPAGDAAVARLLRRQSPRARVPRDGRGGPFVRSEVASPVYPSWFLDRKLEGACNHHARGHMAADLERYFFVACYAKAHGASPRLHDFPRALLPAHANARRADKQTIFNDRFRVQLGDKPSTTITSHISKDGHYFIHPDPSQVRSLTVREAARLQTFPDNYIFEGSRTDQYRQVGNAVPPLLAREIAKRLARALS